MNIAEMFDEQARIRPKARALVDTLDGRERVFTFGELNDKAARVAALLDSQGIAAGNGIIIFHPMAAEWVQ